MSDFAFKEFVPKKGVPCRILKGMVSCGSGVIVAVQRFMEKDEAALPRLAQPAATARPAIKRRQSVWRSMLLERLA